MQQWSDESGGSIFMEGLTGTVSIAHNILIPERI